MRYTKVVGLGLFGLLFLGGYSCGNSPIAKKQEPQKQEVSNTPPEAPKKTGACPIHFDKIGFCGAASWDAEPLVAGVSRIFTLKLWNKDKGSIDGPYQDTGFDVVVKFTMPTMGHGPKKGGVASHPDAGTIVYTGVVFNMAGTAATGDAWQADLTISDPTKAGLIVDSAQISVDVIQ